MDNSKYTKEELKLSERFKERKDCVEALLKDGKEYSIGEAEKIIDKFMKGSVN